MKVLAPIFAIFTEMLFLANCTGLMEDLHSKEDVCRLFPDGVVLRKPGSCQETIKCINGESVPHSVKCTGTKIVKLDKMTCGADSTKSPDKYCTPTCTKNSPTFIQHVKNCHEWSECSANKVVQTGSCPYGQIFDQEGQQCIYDDGRCKKSYDICNVAKTNQRFWDEDNCSKYYYCTAKRELKSERCPTSTYYQVSTGECIKKTEVNCYQHPTPEKVCGTKKLAILNRFVKDEFSCTGYYFCKDLGKDKSGNFIPDESPHWGKCPLNQFFDEDRQACGSINNVKCAEDRCNGRHNEFLLSEKSGCQHYLVCENGRTIEEVKCRDNKYFDPITETCVTNSIWYPICV